MNREEKRTNNRLIAVTLNEMHLFRDFYGDTALKAKAEANERLGFPPAFASHFPDKGSRGYERFRMFHRRFSAFYGLDPYNDSTAAGKDTLNHYRILMIEDLIQIHRAIASEYPDNESAALWIPDLEERLEEAGRIARGEE